MTDDNKVRWSRLISDWESTDLSKAEFARERGLSVHSLRYWLYQLRRESKASVLSHSETEKSLAQSAPKEELRLLPVRAVASARRRGRRYLAGNFCGSSFPAVRVYGSRLARTHAICGLWSRCSSQC